MCLKSNLKNNNLCAVLFHFINFITLRITQNLIVVCHDAVFMLDITHYSYFL